MDDWSEQRALGERTGMIIPAYFSAKPPDDLVRHLLWMTLADCDHYCPLANVWVVVDGDVRTARLAEEACQRLRREQGARPQLIALEANQGKLGAIRVGMRAARSQRPELAWLTVRDGDGDHLPAAMPSLMRAAECVAEARGDSRLIVIGARSSRHRPMGFLRGELEALLDGVTLDALAYALARQGRALDLRYCLPGGLPDLSSGYKVYGADMADGLFCEDAPQFLTLSESDYWHYGPETATVVEAILMGGTLAEVLRPTWDGQPTSSFGEFRLVALYGELLAWVFARLEIPLEAAACWIDNRSPEMALRTTVDGRHLLEETRRHALERVRAFRGGQEPLPAPAASLPFV